MRRRALPAVLIVGVVALVVAVAVLQEQGQRQSAQATAALSAASSCSPSPCADAGGYRVHVDEVSKTGSLVRVQVSFAVHGRQKTHAVPDDFSVHEASGRRDWPVFPPDAGCPRWPRTDIPDRGTLGPETLCFRTSGDGRALTLHWNPDVGIGEAFSPGYDIRI